MRRRTLNKSFLRRWMLGGSILVGLTSFVACSSSGGSGGDDGGGDGDNGMCTEDVSSDPRNCGSCGHACAAGEGCIGGMCRTTCSPPTTMCGTMCADTSSNSLHCGGCNMPCQSGELCVNNACMMGECMGGTTLCAGACVNTQLDLQNCGSCGTRCLQGQSCSAGLCTGGGGTGGTSGTGGSAGSGATGGSAAGMGGNGGSTAGMGGASGSGAGMGGTGGSAAGMGGTGGSAAGTGGTGGGTTGACRVWLAKNGNDSNPGTEASPVATLLKAYDLMCPKPPDGTENGAECLGPAPRSICVKTGEYAMTERLEFRKTRMGTASNRLILQGDPALPLSMRPIFNFSGQTRLGCGENPDNIGGLTVNASYVTVKNLVVRNANDTCILVQGTQDLVENVLTHNCADTGIQISSGGEFTGTGTNNTIRNCDSHSNYDSQCDGENADGFAIKEGTGAGNVFTGCRAWNNTDDGFDLYAWTTAVTIENSWAFDQSRSTEDTGSDGNGFKLGGNNVSAAHILRGLVAVGNANGSNGDGFTPNSNPASLSCSNGCYAWGNTRNVMTGVSGVSTTAQGGANVTNMAADSARNADGSLKMIGSL